MTEVDRTVIVVIAWVLDTDTEPRRTGVFNGAWLSIVTIALVGKMFATIADVAAVERTGVAIIAGVGAADA